jgi:hypothetical protein
MSMNIFFIDKNNLFVNTLTILTLRLWETLSRITSYRTTSPGWKPPSDVIAEDDWLLLWRHVITGGFETQEAEGIDTRISLSTTEVWQDRLLTPGVKDRKNCLLYLLTVQNSLFDLRPVHVGILVSKLTVEQGFTLPPPFHRCSVPHLKNVKAAHTTVQLRVRISFFDISRPL